MDNAWRAEGVSVPVNQGHGVHVVDGLVKEVLEALLSTYFHTFLILHPLKPWSSVVY